VTDGGGRDESLVLPLGGRGSTDPARVGPKAATLARLRVAGFPVPDGFCLSTTAYRAHLGAGGIADAGQALRGADPEEARRVALRLRLACLRDLEPSITAPLDAAWAALGGTTGTLLAVRSSASLEGTARASAAGQFETFLGVASAADLATAVRACWASLWSARVLRYLGGRGLDPAGAAMAVLVQRLVPARAAGGALSRTPDGGVLLTGAWGLGTVVAQGEVVPDRYVVSRAGARLTRVEPGRKARRLDAVAPDGPRWEAVSPGLAAAPCLEETEAVALAQLVLAVEAELGKPVEVEWALDDRGFHLLQARPLARGPGLQDGASTPGPVLLVGQPAGAGRASGPVCVVRSETELARVGAGDVLVTRVAGPALASVLPRVAAVVAELGGSTSHLAALARERGIPAVLGVAEATRRLDDGRPVTVDGVTGTVHARADEVIL
jgi:pyruvate,water dikinase